MITDHRRHHTELDNAILSDTKALTLSAATNTQVAAPGVGRKIVVTAIDAVDTAGAANTLNLLSASTNKGNMELPSNGGHVVTNTPIHCAENEAFRITADGNGTGFLAYSILPV